MIDLSLFTYKEAVELILGFYTFTLGYWEDELEEIPEAKRFVEMKFTKRMKKTRICMYYPKQVKNFFTSTLRVFRRFLLII